MELLEEKRVTSQHWHKTQQYSKENQRQTNGLTTHVHTEKEMSIRNQETNHRI